MERPQVILHGKRRMKCWAREPISSEQHLIRHWLKAAESCASHRLVCLLKRGNLIPSEWAALRLMYGPGRAAPAHIARSIGMTKGGASKLVDRLVKKGLAIKSRSRFDRRFRPVGLTKSGERVVVAVAAYDRRFDQEFVPEAGPQRTQLMGTLKKLVVVPRHWSALRSKTLPARRKKAPEIGPATYFDPVLAILSAFATRG